MFAVAPRAPRNRDPAGARARRLGALRPLHRCDLRLSGRRARRSARADPRARAVDRRRQPAGSHVPVRRAAARLPRAPRSRAQRRARSRSLRGRGGGILRPGPRRLPRPRGRGAAPLPRDRQLAAARRRCAPSSTRSSRRSSTCDGGRTRRRAGDAALAAVAAVAARDGPRRRSRSARHGPTRCSCTGRAASASTRSPSISRKRFCAKRRAPTVSRAGSARAAATRSPAQHPDLMRLELLTIDEADGAPEAGRHDRHRPRTRAHRIRPADEPSPAREGRGDRAGRQDERRRGECVAEDAGGAAARHVPHPRHRTARARFADDPLPLPKARRAAAVAGGSARVACGAGRRVAGARACAGRRRAAGGARVRGSRGAKRTPRMGRVAVAPGASSRRPHLPHESRRGDAKSARRGSRTRWTG